MRSTRTMRPLPPDLDPERLLSKAWLLFFVRVLTHRLRRSFHAIRLARPGVPAVTDGQPLVIYTNHPSWWDAALVPVLMARLFPSRRSFAPIDAVALRRYGFMRRLGPRTLLDYTRLTQNGRYTGWIEASARAAESTGAGLWSACDE